MNIKVSISTPVTSVILISLLLDGSDNEDACLNSSAPAKHFMLVFGTTVVGHRLRDPPVDEPILVTSLHSRL